MFKRTKFKIKRKQIFCSFETSSYSEPQKIADYEDCWTQIQILNIKKIVKHIDCNDFPT